MAIQLRLLGDEREIEQVLAVIGTVLDVTVTTGFRPNRRDPGVRIHAMVHPSPAPPEGPVTATAERLSPDPAPIDRATPHQYASGAPLRLPPSRR